MATIDTSLSTGRRVYIRTKFGEPIINELKALGAKWDAEAKAWWVGTTKRAAIEALLNEAASAEPPKEDLSKARVYAQVSYKDRKYYVIAETKNLVRCRLTTLDGSITFWAECSACELIKRYEPREVWGGRRNSGRTVTRYTTIGSLREFIAERKAEKASGAELCAECGRAGELVQDLEDGLLKHVRCCDIAP